MRRTDRLPTLLLVVEELDIAKVNVFLKMRAKSVHSTEGRPGFILIRFRNAGCYREHGQNRMKQKGCRSSS